MPQEHYFSASPDKPANLRDITFEVAGHEFAVQAASGTFSASKLDPGTSILLSKFEEFPETGNVLDLGCGWGPISLSIATLCPETTLWALDVNERSMELARNNATKLGLTNINVGTADQIPADLKFDSIWSNPPIRIGKAALHELLKIWLPRLESGGRAMLVVQKQLGADSLLTWIQSEFPELTASRFSTDKGFRVLEITRD
jgi:16S rRNA (guanine1207-N2)-methyltransferase